MLGPLSAGDYRIQPYSKDKLEQDKKTHSEIHIIFSLSPEKNREQVTFGVVFLSFSECSALVSPYSILKMSLFLFSFSLQIQATGPISDLSP